MTTQRHNFHKEWLRNPMQVGAIAPSSASLAAAMTHGLDAASGPVLELGPGTGIFTRQLLSQGVLASRITAIEASHSFSASLAEAFPEITIRHGFAGQMRGLVDPGQAPLHTVISGLPLLSMAPATVYRIVARSFQLLAPEGEFRLFTYGPTCPVPRSMRNRLNLSEDRSHFVSRNLPPASVFCLRRASPHN